MFGLTGTWVYVLIFVGKLIEVSCTTLRIMFAGKGKKLVSSLFGLCEVFLWLTIASGVISGLNEDPMKAVVYCLAFSCGISLGVIVENKMAVGLISMQIVSLSEDAENIGVKLRDNGFGVTILDGHSVDGTKREVVFVQLRRKRVEEAMKIALSENPEAIISVSEAKTVHGGFFSRSSK